MRKNLFQKVMTWDWSPYVLDLLDRDFKDMKSVGIDDLPEPLENLVNITTVGYDEMENHSSIVHPEFYVDNHGDVESIHILRRIRQDIPGLITLYKPQELIAYVVDEKLVRTEINTSNKSDYENRFEDIKPGFFDPISFLAGTDVYGHVDEFTDAHFVKSINRVNGIETGYYIVDCKLNEKGEKNLLLDEMWRVAPTRFDDKMRFQVYVVNKLGASGNLGPHVTAVHPIYFMNPDKA